MNTTNILLERPEVNSSNKGLTLLLIGSTGAVGQQVLRLALGDARIRQVVALTRRPLSNHPKLLNAVVDFTNLPPDAPWWQVDSVICTLGTTIKAARSQSAFAAIDRDLPIQIGRLARDAGATRYALNSSLGASQDGNFYLRTKAEAEQGIGELKYPVYTIVRPSLIDATRADSRPAERVGLAVARLLRPLIPKRYRAVRAEAIAQALIDGVIREVAGKRVIESESLQN